MFLRTFDSLAYYRNARIKLFLDIDLHELHAVCEDASVFAKVYTDALYFFQLTRLDKYQKYIKSFRLYRDSEAV